MTKRVHKTLYASSRKPGCFPPITASRSPLRLPFPCACRCRTSLSPLPRLADSSHAGRHQPSSHQPLILDWMLTPPGDRCLSTENVLPYFPEEPIRSSVYHLVSIR